MFAKFYRPTFFVVLVAIALLVIIPAVTRHPRSAVVTTTTTTVNSPTSAPTTTVVASSTTTVPHPQSLKIPLNGRTTILVIGDSLGTDLGGGLSLQLEKSPQIRLIQKGKTLTGLSNAWYYNWPRHLKSDLTKYRPQLLIVFVGGNDEQGIEVNGHPATFASTAWRKQYAKNVATMMREATKTGTAVLWVGMPIMDPNGYRQGMQIINSLFARVATTIPGVTFLPTWQFFASHNGQFRFNASVNGKLQAIRTPDGIHPTAVGQGVLATYIIKELRSLYHLRVTPAFPMNFTK